MQVVEGLRLNDRGVWRKTFVCADCNEEFKGLKGIGNHDCKGRSI